MKQLFVAQTEILGQAYQLTNQILKKLPCQIVELSPTGLEGLVLLMSEDEKFFEVLKKENLINENAAYLSPLEEKILKCYFSLYNAPLSEGLLILESSSVPALFDEAQKLLKLGFDICEFRVQRTTKSPGYIWLTASIDLIKKSKVSHPKVKATTVFDIQPALKEFLF